MSLGPVNKYTNTEDKQCRINQINHLIKSKFQKMSDSSHYLFYKKNMTILNQTPNQSSNTAIGGNGDATQSVQKFKKGNSKKGVDKKHGSYARYLASKAARARYCPPTKANIQSYKTTIDNNGNSQDAVQNIHNYVDFLSQFRCLPKNTAYNSHKLVTYSSTKNNKAWGDAPYGLHGGSASK
jgi:hypothetical protein